MDATAFDRLSRTLWLTGSRRTALSALLGSAAAVRGLAGTDRAIAQEECKTNGQRCSDGTECCSGRCHRRRRSGPKVCRQAANQGECTVEDNICSGTGIICGTGTGGSVCHCFVTITGRSFCGAELLIQGNCDCTSNQECEDLVGKGARCVQATDACDGACPGSTTGCMAPCENLDPVS